MDGKIKVWFEVTGAPRLEVEVDGDQVKKGAERLRHILQRRFKRTFQEHSLDIYLARTLLTLPKLESLVKALRRGKWKTLVRAVRKLRHVRGAWSWKRILSDSFHATIGPAAELGHRRRVTISTSLNGWTLTVAIPVRGKTDLVKTRFAPDFVHAYLMMRLNGNFPYAPTKQDGELLASAWKVRSVVARILSLVWPKFNVHHLERNLKVQRDVAASSHVGVHGMFGGTDTMVWLPCLCDRISRREQIEIVRRDAANSML
jgi:hypothetical protein